jgi:hypothetical protein
MMLTYPHEGHSYCQNSMVFRCSGGGRRSRSKLPKALVLESARKDETVPQTAQPMTSPRKVVMRRSLGLHGFNF